METHGHAPVLLGDVLNLLSPRGGEVVLDCTAGRGGHAEALAAARRERGGGSIVLCDLDKGNLDFAEQRVLEAGGESVEVRTMHGNFVSVPRRMAELGLSADCVLADLGFSSNQMDDRSRGLSFQGDGPLDMRLDPTGPVSAADLIASVSEQELSEILRDFGEERQHRQIARKVIAVRAQTPIRSTAELAEIVRSVVGSRGPSAARGTKKPIHPATKTFQALRIAVNDELGNLDALLEAVQRAGSAMRIEAGGGDRWVRHGTRIAIISFHSLEDRRVKRAFAALEDRGLAQVLTARPISANEDEVWKNPRSRSAKLRAVRMMPKPAEERGDSAE
ncbi:MAG: 16S rRNA (cytosine(1402)-N(4))-methyltransferase RsmH [Phycisphaerales bacterium]